MAQTEDKTVDVDLLSMIPALRGYARSLTRNVDDADDLVQETLVKAINNIANFQPGTKLRAWLFTIMRNTFFTNIKKRKREPTGNLDCVSSLPTSLPDHDRVIESRRIYSAIAALPVHYREMLILVVMIGESYEDAAKISNVSIGTVKSRVNRGRNLLVEHLGGDTLSQMVSR